MNTVHFLRDVGKEFRIGYLLSRDIVKQRLEGDGISFTEFSYTLLQAYDFLHLFKNEKCVLQIGGADQWVNIVSGINYIKKMENKSAYGLTIPLLTDSNNEKIGKSSGSPIWLNAALTSSYDFYQFFFNMSDQDVQKFLLMLTFLSKNEINDLIQEHAKKPEQRIAQIKLAEEITRYVHGDVGLEKAQISTKVLFGESINSLNYKKLLIFKGDTRLLDLKRSDVIGKKILDVAQLSNFVESRNSLKRLITGGGLYIKENKVESLDQIIEEKKFNRRKSSSNTHWKKRL